MLFNRKFSTDDSAALVETLNRVQAVIEFDLQGTILTANANFLAAVGYTLPEIVGRHHSLFVDDAYRSSAEYRDFWEGLRAGRFSTGRFRRIGKGGRELWLEASYTPVLDRAGRPVRVVKFATDITDRMRQDADRAGQIAAIRKAQAVIEFDLDGNILDANETFLQVVGYDLSEIKGRHHSLFVDKAYARGAEYAAFWEALRRGEFQSARYRRIGKGGRAVWIQATYNPILDASGRPTKVVKFATDVTDQVKLLDDLRAIIEVKFRDIETALATSTTETQVALDKADRTTRTVHSLAAGVEELSSSIAEIASSMTVSRGASDRAYEQVSAADRSTGKLTGAAQAMSGIVQLIQSIAEQINLLALNATIESARAGDAGRGFAVVAQEVKNLANQASRATDQITVEINGIQSVSGEVVVALGDIRTSVAHMRDAVLSTASAVEEQSAVTRDMAANMQGTADEVGVIATNVGAIAAAIAAVSAAVSDTRAAAEVLAR